MTPGNVLFPKTLAREAAALAKKAGVKAEILEPVQIRKLKMGGAWDVGKGSAHLPRVIVLKYNGNTRKKTVVTIVPAVENMPRAWRTGRATS